MYVNTIIIKHTLNDTNSRIFYVEMLSRDVDDNLVIVSLESPAADPVAGVPTWRRRRSCSASSVLTRSPAASMAGSAGECVSVTAADSGVVSLQE